MEYSQARDETRVIARGRVAWLFLVLSLLVIGTFLLAPPWTVLGKTRLVGYAICHQIPDRSFHIAGHQLPLCARCTGIYMGALVGFALMMLWGRRRSATLPPVPITLTFIGFIVVLGIDGVNSYLSFFPTMPRLYEPQNWLRLTTGTLEGLALSAFVYPVLNYTLWRDAVESPSVQSFKELALMVAIGGVVIVLVLLELPVLLYPLAILSTLGVLVMLGAINTMIVLALTRREGVALTWQQALLPVMVGLAFAFLEIGGFDPSFPLAAAEDRDLCDRWREKGWPMRHVPAARIGHAHDLNLGAFMRQHFNYGRGAYLFHSRRAARSGEPIRMEPPGFYAGLAAFPFTRYGGRHRLSVAALVLVSQVANAVGFFVERRRSPRKN